MAPRKNVPAAQPAAGNADTNAGVAKPVATRATRSTTALTRATAAGTARASDDADTPTRYRFALPAALPKASVQDDLKTMFGTKKAGDLMQKREPKVDSTTQRSSTFVRHPVKPEKDPESPAAIAVYYKRLVPHGVSGRAAKGTVAGRGRARGARGTKSQVYIGGDGSLWVLFDPVRGWPPIWFKEPTPIFERLSRFKPGNTKIVAFNRNSGAVAVRKTPQKMKGCEVEYLPTGPVLKPLEVIEVEED